MFSSRECCGLRLWACHSTSLAPLPSLEPVCSPPPEAVCLPPAGMLWECALCGAVCPLTEQVSLASQSCQAALDSLLGHTVDGVTCPFV